MRLEVREPDPPVPAIARRAGMGALRHHNYRLYFIGQIISTVGTWMQSVAMPWLALTLTHDAFHVGLVIATQFTPMLVAGQFGGLLADRFPKRRILVSTQLVSILPALVMFFLTSQHLAQYWMVLAAALAVGSINVVDVPCRQAFAIEMVGREDLLNAIALNSTIFNASAVIGPSIAGVIIGLAGVPLCFLINAISYIASVTTLLLMVNLPALLKTSQQASVLERIKEGLDYARHDALVGTLLLNVAVFSLFAMNRFTLLPIFADQVLHVGPTGFGFLTASQGIGALVGALSLAVLQRRLASGNVQFLIGVAWSTFLVGFSLSRSFPLSVLLLMLAGYCQIAFVATTNSRIQAATPDHLRGRVMALYAQALMGVGPVGSFQAGALAHFFGAPFAMALGAVVSALFVGASRLVRPAVFEKDPPITVGLNESR
jgi:MFS family permease